MSRTRAWIASKLDGNLIGPQKWISKGCLFLIVLLAAFLRSYNLDEVGRNGLGNTYYAAAVNSMLTSWRNFFYLSVDPAGFISLDKPPLVFWIQAVSAKIFGFHGLNLILPGAIAGIFSVILLYLLVRRGFGEWAGILAALVAALPGYFSLFYYAGRHLCWPGLHRAGGYAGTPAGNRTATGQYSGRG